MKFDVKKTENCFADAKTYEYRLPINGRGFIAFLEGWEVTENHKYRRPLFSAGKDGVNAKGILEAHTIRVNYPENRWESEKAAFENWLSSLVTD